MQWRLLSAAASAQEKRATVTDRRYKRSSMSAPCEIVRAHPSAAPILSAIVHAAKAHWGYPAHWLEHWRDQLTITPEFIAAHETFMAEVDGEIVGFHALVETPESWRLEHLWVLPKAIGRGFGRSLFSDAAARARKRGALRLTIEADPHAEPFYKHMGAVRTGVIRSVLDGRVRELPLLRFDLTCSRGP